MSFFSQKSNRVILNLTLATCFAMALSHFAVAGPDPDPTLAAQSSQPNKSADLAVEAVKTAVSALEKGAVQADQMGRKGQKKGQKGSPAAQSNPPPVAHGWSASCCGVTHASNYVTRFSTFCGVGCFEVQNEKEIVQSITPAAIAYWQSGGEEKPNELVAALYYLRNSGRPDFTDVSNFNERELIEWIITYDKE